MEGRCSVERSLKLAVRSEPRSYPEQSPAAANQLPSSDNTASASAKPGLWACGGSAEVSNGEASADLLITDYVLQS